MIYSGEGLSPSDSGEVNLMFVFLNPEVFNSDLRADLVEQIEEITQKFSNEHAYVHYSGMPYIRTVVQNRVKGELKIFLILDHYI